MTVQSAPYFWLVCDGCGCSSADGAALIEQREKSPR